MKVIVCLKMIADPDIIEYDLADEQLRNLSPIMDPINYSLLEEGIRIREHHGGEVIALSVASEMEEVFLRDALVYGADRALRVWDGQRYGADTFCTSQLLSKAIQRVGFDLILCGTRSSDQGSECMVSFLSHSLAIPFATRIVSLVVNQGEYLLAHKKLQRGERELYRLRLPAIVGLEPGINEPRYVAPYSRTYQKGMRKNVEYIPLGVTPTPLPSFTALLHYTQSRPRVKVGIDISALSMEEKLKMMRGELGGKKEIIEGDPHSAAQKIATKLFELIR